jgi:hypothetical protein
MKINPDDRPATRSSMASTRADLRELRGNSQASVLELQAFLRDLKGKSPQEMLGVVAANQLVRSVALSAGLIFATLLLFTAIPYFSPTPAAAPTSPSPTAHSPAPPSQLPALPNPLALPDPPPPASQADPLSTLGVGEELSAPPNSNPLDNQGDDFLKDLE